MNEDANFSAETAPDDIGTAPPPMRLSSVKVSGIAASAGRSGDSMKVVSRFAATSDSYAFHRIANGIVDVLETSAGRDGIGVNLRGAMLLLAVVKPDETAELYIDSAPIVITARIKRDTEAGQAVFEHEISDILAIQFPTVNISSVDQVIVIIRERFRYGIYFDLSKNIDLRVMQETLGRLVRQMRYHEAYAVQSDPALLDLIIAAGWFPFVEINNVEFANIFMSVRQPDELLKVEQITVEAFTSDRVTSILERWLRHPTFKRREAVLRSGAEAFLANNPIAAIKTLITEIEGILQDVHIAAVGRNEKIPKLIEFVASEAIAKAGAPDTLMLPPEFQRYLGKNIFKCFDPMVPDQHAARHSVSHGAAVPESYTMVRALQVLLTLDQLSFFL